MKIRKIITLLNYLSQHIDCLTKLKAAKLIYFIDKFHLTQYGRFVTHDRYSKLPLGPVPSNILNLINDPYTSLTEEDACFLNKNISFENTSYRTISSTSAPDLDELSDSETTIIQQVIEVGVDSVELCGDGFQ